MRWRSPITLVVLLGLLLAAAYYGWHTIVTPVTASDEPPPAHHGHHKKPKAECVQHKTYRAGTQIGAGSFRVNVYNASAVNGRAAQVLASLASKGFKQGVAANPPSGMTATNVSILTSTPTSPRVQLVKEQFRGHVALVAGPELHVGIDVVVGPDFVGVAPEAPSTYKVPKTVTLCVKYALPSH